MRDLAIADNAFDAVFAYHVVFVQDFQSGIKTMEEIKRVLKPRESLFVTFCSKEHHAFKNPKYQKIDENTVIKNNEIENGALQFFR